MNLRIKKKALRRRCSLPYPTYCTFYVPASITITKRPHTGPPVSRLVPLVAGVRRPATDSRSSNWRYKQPPLPPDDDAADMELQGSSRGQVKHKKKLGRIAKKLSCHTLEPINNYIVLYIFVVKVSVAPAVSTKGMGGGGGGGQPTPGQKNADIEVTDTNDDMELPRVCYSRG